MTNRQILIVEDEPFIALDLAYACSDAGFETQSATTNRQALQALTNHEFVGAILDVNLGRGETCEAVVDQLRKMAIPFVLNTGDLNRAGEHLRGLGAPIIPKPTLSSQVVQTLIEHGNLANEP